MTVENRKITGDTRKLSPLERMFFHAPYAIVTMVARIKGSVSEQMLIKAVANVQQRHQNLRVRIQVDRDHIPWFTSEGVGEIPVKVVPREADQDWIRVFHQECQIPFEFEAQPAIRFILVQSPSISDLIIFCHHTICDGLSLAYLARDLLAQLGEPAQKVDVLPDPQPIDLENMPQEVSLNPVVKFFVKRINKQWDAEKIFFDQADYQDLNKTYWLKTKHKIISIELTEEQTSVLVGRCKKENVTVNSALATAFAGAGALALGDKAGLGRIGVAGSVRERVPKPPGESMGFYAGMVTLNFKYEPQKGFWENVRRFHQKARPLYTDKNLFKDPLLWNILDASILESLSFKMLGGLVPAHFERYPKLSAFSTREDVVSTMLKRENMDSLDKILMGLAITNLTRMDFPRQYGALELDRLIMNPGAGYPLTMVNLVLGAVTCSGKLSLVVEYADEAIATGMVEEIRNQAVKALLGE